MIGGYNRFEYSDVPQLVIMQNFEGKYFVGATSAIMLLTDQRETSAKTSMTKFLQKHFAGRKDFPSITNSDDTDKIVVYKTYAGRSSYAFSVSGLEFLTGSLFGLAVAKNFDKLLTLINDIKSGQQGKFTPSPPGEVVSQQEIQDTPEDAACLDDDQDMTKEQCLNSRKRFFSGEPLLAPDEEANVFKMSRLDPVVSEIQTDLAGIKTDLAEMKADMCEIKTTLNYLVEFLRRRV